MINYFFISEDSKKKFHGTKSGSFDTNYLKDVAPERALA